jgi:hypothetical protein
MNKMIQRLNEMDSREACDSSTYWFGITKRAEAAKVFDDLRNQKFDFKKYIGENWRTYELFQEYALEAATKNVKVSATMVVERIRWNVRIEKVAGDKFKANNNATPFFARLFAFEYPEYSKIFDFRGGNKVEQDEKYQN